MKILPKTIAIILLSVPFFIFIMFNYFEIPKKILFDTVFFFENYGKKSALFFIIFYILSIILFLPLGIIFHIMAGLFFGSFYGYIYSQIAILLATSIAFYFSSKNLIPFFRKQKEKNYHFIKKFKLTNNEILNLFLLRLTIFVPISIQNILSIFVTSNIIKLLLITIITTTPPMLAIIISASKIKNNLNYDQFLFDELTKIYFIIFLLLILIFIFRMIIIFIVNKNKC